MTQTRAKQGIGGTSPLVRFADLVTDRPSMVTAGPATRISIGCQTFFFSRDEAGYSVSTREYMDWRLSGNDFRLLVESLAELLPSKEEA